MSGDNFSPGLTAPTTDFRAVRDARRTPILKFEVDLTTARSIAAGTQLVLSGVIGNVLYIDQSLDAGIATVYMDDRREPNPAGLTMTGGYAIAGAFYGVVIENLAQPGRFLRLRYGVDIDFRPSVFQVSGIINTQEQGYTYGASYASNTPMGAGGSAVVFLPASNPRGAIVHSESGYSVDADGANGFALIAKTGSAPTTIIDGDVLIAGGTSVTGGAVTMAQLTAPIKLPAGKGLWWYSNNAEEGSLRHVLYTLL